MCNLPDIGRSLRIGAPSGDAGLVCRFLGGNLLARMDEIEATEAWKVLIAESVPNVYILEGGINGWLDIFAAEEIGIRPLESAGEGELGYEFASALGAAYQVADPDYQEFELEFTPKIKLELKRAPSGGGCG